MTLPHHDEGLAAATSNAISALLDAHACSICHDLLSAPVSLPCSHVFCSECVRRHLSAKSTCPHPTCRNPTTYTQLTPLRGYDVALEPLRRAVQKVEPTRISDQQRLVFLSRKACARAQLLDRLRTHGIPTHGGLDALAHRYNDFVIRWNANLDAGVPKSKKSVVATVLAAERASEKGSRKLRGASSFFARASSGNSEGDVDLPVEGDDFATLVQKTKARMERKRKLAAAAQTSSKRLCSAAEHASGVSSGTQSKTKNDSCEGGNGGAQEPPVIGSLSQVPTGGMTRLLSDVSRQAKNPNASRSFRPLSICSLVCALDVGSDSVMNSEGNGLPCDPQFPNEHSPAVVPPPARMWSQTTPEKDAKVTMPASVGVSNSVEIGTTDPKKRLPRPGVFMPTSTLCENASGSHNIKSTAPRAATTASSFEQSRTSEKLNYPSHVIRHRPPLQLPSDNDVCEESRRPAQGKPPVEAEGWTESAAADTTPTRAQLERAERNRLAAIQRRLRFYARQELSQMRQPEL